MSEDASWFSWFSRKKLTDKPLPSGAQYIELDDPSERIVRLVSGREHAVILTQRGHVYSTGLTDLANRYGQLGIGPTLETMTHKKSVDDNASEELVKQADQAWLGSGTPKQKQVSQPELVGKPVTKMSFSKITNVPWKQAASQPVEMACGAYHTLLRCADGTVYGWGSNNPCNYALDHMILSRKS